MSLKIKEEKILDIIDNHKVDKLSVSEISKLQGLPNSTIYAILKRRCVTIDKSCTDRRMYKVNDNYFDVIDTTEKAYILGLLAADGCVTSRNRLLFKLEVSDIEVVKYVSSKLSDRPLQDDKRIASSGKFCHSVRLEIVSKRLTSSLSKLGIGLHKTSNEIFPDIKDEFKPAFILGFFDGDGSVSRRNIPLKRKKSIQVYICCTNRKFLEDIQVFLGFGSLYTERRKTLDMYTLRFNSFEDKRKLFNLLYSSHDFYMERKYNLYSSYINTVLSYENGSQCNA